MRVIALVMFAVVVSGCGSIWSPGGGEPSSPEEWATATCKVVSRMLVQPLTVEGGDALSRSLDDAVVDLDAIEPASGAGRLHDRLTDQLEAMSGSIRELTSSGAAPSVIDAEWLRLRDQAIARVNDAAADLPPDVRSTFDNACGDALSLEQQAAVEVIA